ncbi:hypothetical protein GCM10025868_35500 [Angustibacter aerolatus]|uniref:Uncharacterized protein n=1 Tax=Angustibacter aerolatus TaxID=1162965 RepID=A0ABQ6JNG7_9ACTN|nr:hypothetical protein GCM10025868_35500 [Angustibacter aerolatus]
MERTAWPSRLVERLAVREAGEAVLVGLRREVAVPVAAAQGERDLVEHRAHGHHGVTGDRPRRAEQHPALVLLGHGHRQPRQRARRRRHPRDVRQRHRLAAAGRDGQHRRRHPLGQVDVTGLPADHEPSAVGVDDRGAQPGVAAHTSAAVRQACSSTAVRSVTPSSRVPSRTSAASRRLRLLAGDQAEPEVAGDGDDEQVLRQHAEHRSERRAADVAGHQVPGQRGRRQGADAEQRVPDDAPVGAEEGAQPRGGEHPPERDLRVRRGQREEQGAERLDDVERQPARPSRCRSTWQVTTAAAPSSTPATATPLPCTAGGMVMAMASSPPSRKSSRVCCTRPRSRNASADSSLGTPRTSRSLSAVAGRVAARVTG